MENDPHYFGLLRRCYVYGIKYLYDPAFREKVKRTILNKHVKIKKIRKLGSQHAYNQYVNARKRAKQRILGDRSHGFCTICRHKFPKEELSIDHIKKISEGGSNHKSNLQLVCIPCHTKKDRVYFNKPFKQLLSVDKPATK